MALTDVTTITFDADDTLWDFNAGMLTAPRPLRAEIAELVGGAVETLGALRREAIRRSASDAGLSDSSVVDGLFDLYISARLANTPLLPETESTLAILGERFQLGAITNSDADPVAFGLSSQFSFAVLADVEPYRKPDPCIFQHAASIGGYQLGRSIHVGDSLTTDVRGANRAGAISVWLDRNRDAMTHRSRHTTRSGLYRSCRACSASLDSTAPAKRPGADRGPHLGARPTVDRSEPMRRISRLST